MMTPAITAENALQETTRPSVMARLRYQLYLMVILGIPAAFLLSSIVLVRSSSFSRIAGDPFLLNPDYAFSLQNVDCGILIYGDSTAVTGIDPTVVSRVTGLKSCNIAQSKSALEVTGLIALDTYLRNNKPPKYLLIQFAPETLSRDPYFYWPEGLTILLRRKPLPVALLTMLRHPVESYNFAMWAVRAEVTALEGHTPDFSSTQAIFAAHGGLLILPKPAETSCNHNVPFRAPAEAWIDQLRRRYSINGTRVLINVSPLPSCVTDAQRIADSMKNITDNTLELYPIRMFSDLDRHLNMEGAQRSSEQIGKQILALENAQTHN
jgi:hypothetical protein